MENILGMFGGGGFTPFSESQAQRHYEDLYIAEQPKHESSFTHEAIAAAAGFAAMHAYESHLRATGQEVSHGTMKEILAAIAAAEVDKLAETKGLDWMDRHKAKKLAEHQAHALAEARYQGGTGWEYAQSAQGGPAYEYNYGGSTPYGAQGCPSYGWYEQRYNGGYGGGYGGGGYEQGPGYGGGYAPPPPQQGYYGGGGYGQGQGQGYGQGYY